MTVQRLGGSAYRDGRLVCARVAVTVMADALSPRLVGVRFAEGVEQRLRGELERLMERRGAFAARLAERLDPVEIVGWDADRGREWRLVGRLERPVALHRPLTETEFALREASEPAAVAGSSRAGVPRTVAGSGGAGMPRTVSGSSCAGEPTIVSGSGAAGEPRTVSGSGRAGEPTIVPGSSGAGVPTAAPGSSRAGEPTEGRPRPASLLDVRR